MILNYDEHIPNLHTGTAYQIRVVSKNGAEDEAPAEWQEFVTLGVGKVSSRVTDQNSIMDPEFPRWHAIPKGGANLLLSPKFPESCMKMNKNGLRGGRIFEICLDLTLHQII